MKIGIIDDQKHFINMIHRRILRNDLIKDAKVDTYHNPIDFLVKGIVYDILFLDIDMPQVDGISLAKKIIDKKITVRCSPTMLMGVMNNCTSERFSTKSMLSC